MSTGPKPNRPEWAFTENFEEEMNQIPLFMNSLPENFEDNELLSALQTLKFDGTPEENALNFKELGNESYKAGSTKFQDAIQYYTQALDQNCSDQKLNVICLTNRAAVNLELGNFGKVLSDCSTALKLDKTNQKAYYRSAKALHLLERSDDAINCIECGLQYDPDNKALQDLLATCLKRKQELDERARIKLERENKEKQRISDLENALQIAKIQFRDSDDRMYKPDLKSNNSVRFDTESNQLIWPVFFLYPEFKESDFIEQFHDQNTFSDHLEVMFQEPAPFDDQSNPKYLLDHLEVYFESFPTNQTKPTLLKIGKKLTLAKILSHPKYFVVNGIPSFIILSKASPSFKDEFIQRYKE